MGKVQCNKTKKERKLSMQGMKALYRGNPRKGGINPPLWELKKSNLTYGSYGKF